MPKVSLDCECELCEFRTKEYGTKWRDHLLEEGHQKLTRENNRTLKDGNKKRRCVVFGIRGLRRRDVLSFFSEKDVVTEFIFWAETPDICLVEFLFPKATEDVARGTRAILGNEVVVRLRNKITDVEWRAICPMAAVCMKTEAEVDGVQKMECDKVRCDGTNSDQNATAAAKKDKERVSVSRRDVEAKRSAVTESNHPKIIESRPAAAETTNADESEDLFEVVIQDSHSNMREVSCASVDFALSGNSDESKVVEESSTRKRRLSLRTVRTPREEVNDYQNVRQTVPAVCTSYCLTMAPSKRFLLGAANATILLDSPDRAQVAHFRRFFWAHLIQEYNLLVWENLFGFELYEITAKDSRQSGRLRLNEGYVKAGPLMRGTLTVMDKLADWILNTEPRDKRAKMMDFKRQCLKSLEEGLEPKPLRFFNSKARSVCNTNAAFVRFDLQASHAGPGPGNNPTNPLMCDLNFYNIKCSHDFPFDSLKMVLGMYERIWRQFCLLKFRDS